MESSCSAFPEPRPGQLEKEAAKLWIITCVNKFPFSRRRPPPPTTASHYAPTNSYTVCETINIFSPRMYAGVAFHDPPILQSSQTFAHERS